MMSDIMHHGTGLFQPYSGNIRLTKDATQCGTNLKHLSATLTNAIGEPKPQPAGRSKGYSGTWHASGANSRLQLLCSKRTRRQRRTFISTALTSGHP